ncbi:MAG: hypothetical protein ACYTFA_03060 [Planctomycetota bacterium]|jgi:hypothetical protein
MSVFLRSNAVKFANRTVRLLLTLTVLPAVAISPLSTEAILVHYHHGHDVHSHGLTLDELDTWQRDPEHHHEEHEHDGRPVDLPEEDGSPIVIVFDLPDALIRVRGLSTGTFTVSGPVSTPRPITATVVGDTCKSPSFCGRPWTVAPNLRADRIVAGILQSNHALLL